MSLYGMCMCNLTGEWIISKHTQNPQKVILYLHGGAYCFGSFQALRPFLIYLSKQANARVLAVDYRLAPEYPYPGNVTLIALDNPR